MLARQSDFTRIIFNAAYHIKRKGAIMRSRTGAIVSGSRISIKLLLALASVLMSACATAPTPLNQFVDELHAKLINTKPISRLTVTQIALGQGDHLLRTEQDVQCSSDPILLFLGDEIIFKLKATVGGEVGVSSPTIKITGSGEHNLDWKVTPVSLGNLANITFANDMKIAQNVVSEKDAQQANAATLAIKNDLVCEAWKLRTELTTIATNLIANWKKPSSCP